MKKILIITLALALIMCLATSSMAAFSSKATVTGLKANGTVSSIGIPTLAATWLSYVSATDTTADPTKPLAAGTAASFGTMSISATNEGIFPCNNALQVAITGNLAGWGVSLYTQNYNATNNPTYRAQLAATDKTMISSPTAESLLVNAKKGLVSSSNGKETMSLRWCATPTLDRVGHPGDNSAFISDTGATIPVNTTLWGDSVTGWKYMSDASSEPVSFGGGSVDFPSGSTLKLRADYTTDPSYATFMNALNASDFSGNKAFIYFIADARGASATTFGTETLTVEFYTN